MFLWKSGKACDYRMATQDAKVLIRSALLHIDVQLFKHIHRKREPFDVITRRSRRLSTLSTYCKLPIRPNILSCEGSGEHPKEVMNDKFRSRLEVQRTMALTTDTSETGRALL